MIRKWFEEEIKRWLMGRGYWIIPAGVPVLVISYGVAVKRETSNGATMYEVCMPKGHKLWALNNTHVVDGK